MSAAVAVLRQQSMARMNLWQPIERHGGAVSLRVALFDTDYQPTSAGDGTSIAILGRITVAIDAQQVLVLRPAEDAGKQLLWLARYVLDQSKQLQRIKVAYLQGKGRETGFPN
jgi:hypothetical protein